MKVPAPTVAEYMTPGPYTIEPRQPLREARRLMEEHAVRHLPVREDHQLVGILSQRDLELVWTLAHAPSDVLTVEDAMTPNPYAIPPSAPLDEVVHAMAERKIGSAVVVESGHIVGVFTATDAMRALVDILRSRRMHAEKRNDEGIDAASRVRGIVAVTARLPADVSVEDAAGAVMGTLAERLTAGEAMKLLDAMPPSLRVMVEPFVQEREGKPTSKLDRAAFIAKVGDRLGVIPAHAEIICEAVFQAVRRELPTEVVEHVARGLPRGISELWLAVAPVEPIAEATLPADDARQLVVDEIESAVELPRGVHGEDAFSAVMCALSERLSGGEARDLVLGLPQSLRPLVETCVTDRPEPGRVFGRDELLRRVEDHLHVDATRAEATVRAGISAVKRVLPERAVLDVASQLPADLLELWELS